MDLQMGVETYLLYEALCLKLKAHSRVVGETTNNPENKVEF